MLRKFFLTLIVFSLGISNVNAFEIYQYLRWNYIKGKDGVIKFSESPLTETNIFESYGLKKMNVIYPIYIITDGEVDPLKIKKIVVDSKINPNMPICFDIEMGNGKNADDDLLILIDALKMYRSLGGKAPIGIYASLPQRIIKNYRGLNEREKAEYLELNKQYEPLAKYVDFLSPTLYFYSKNNSLNWASQVNLNMSEARKYANKYKLKIYPFISLSTWDVIDKKFYITPVSEVYMTNVLLSLKRQGADGVVLWEGGASKSSTDKQPAIFDTNKDSFKAVIDFAKKY